MDIECVLYETQYWYVQMWLHLIQKEGDLNMPTSTKVEDPAFEFVHVYFHVYI